VAALKLGVATRGNDPEADEGYARLRELLRDPDANVRRAAASSLGLLGAVDALDEILELLEREAEPTPVAAAATFIAIRAPQRVQERVVAALDRFASMGDANAAQVDELRWRIGGGRRRGYAGRIDCTQGTAPDRNRPSRGEHP
jgi:hypothetical protein